MPARLATMCVTMAYMSGRDMIMTMTCFINHSFHQHSPPIPQKMFPDSTDYLGPSFFVIKTFVGPMFFFFSGPKFLLLEKGLSTFENWVQRSHLELGPTRSQLVFLPCCKLYGNEVNLEICQCNTLFLLWIRGVFPFYLFKPLVLLLK